MTLVFPCYSIAQIFSLLANTYTYLTEFQIWGGGSRFYRAIWLTQKSLSVAHPLLISLSHPTPPVSMSVKIAGLCTGTGRNLSTLRVTSYILS